MKKIFIIFSILLIAAVIGAVIFLMTLDVDSFRPRIVSLIEDAIKKPVRLEKVKLGWRSGIALELQGFAVLTNGKDPEALVKAGSVKAVLELAPLLARRVQIAAVYLDRPSVRLIKKPDGTFDGFEPAARQPDRQKGEAPPKEAAALSFLVSKIRVSGGEIFFKDTSGKEPAEMNLRKIDATIKNVALDRPVDLKAKAAVFNDAQNLDIKGKLTISSQDRTGTVSGLHAELRLAPMDLREIVKAVPAVQAAGIVPPLGGTAEVDIDSLALNEQGLKNAAARARLTGGAVLFKNASGKEPAEMNLRKIDATIEMAALDRPVDLKAKAAVFNDAQNLDIKGKLTISSQDRTGTVSGLHAELRLAPMDLREIVKAVPAVQAAGIVPPLEGTVEVDVDSLALNEQGLKNAAARIGLDRGQVRLKSLENPVGNISFNVLATAAAIEARKFAASVAGGTVEGTGTVSFAGPADPETVFDMRADKIRIEALTQAPRPGEPGFKGLLSLTVKGKLAGNTPERIRRTAVAEGTAVVEQAVITDKNILREIFQKMSMIPGLVEKLLSRLPENYREKLSAKDTVLGTIKLPFTVRDGTARFPRINAATDSFRVSGSGTYGLDQGAVAGNAVIAIEPELSMAMTRSVAELQYLMNADQEVQLPLALRGKVPDITVTPDLQFIASQIAAKEAARVVGGYLQKAIGGKGASTGTGTASGSGSRPKSKEILGDILQEGLRGILSQQ